MRVVDPVDELLRGQPRLIRSFIEFQKYYSKLAEEVSYTLEHQLAIASVEYAHVIARTKTLKSFCEKVFRKRYKNPISDVTDLCGVRVVYLYFSDLVKIEKIIETQFEVIEKIDKIDSAEPDRFGYGALHYLVRLNDNCLGARYDELRGLVCEIQVRTVMQDAWALIAHHLMYKQKSDIPKKLVRKFSALSGLFETADTQFDSLRDERGAYAIEVKRQIFEQQDIILHQQINLESLSEYLAWKFPDRENDNKEEVSELLSELYSNGYGIFNKLDEMLDSTIQAVEAYERKYPPSDEEDFYEEEEERKITRYTRVGAVRVSLDLILLKSGVDKEDFLAELKQEFVSLIK